MLSKKASVVTLTILLISIYALLQHTVSLMQIRNSLIVAPLPRSAGISQKPCWIFTTASPPSSQTQRLWTTLEVESATMHTVETLGQFRLDSTTYLWTSPSRMCWCLGASLQTTVQQHVRFFGHQAKHFQARYSVEGAEHWACSSMNLSTTSLWKYPTADLSATLHDRLVQACICCSTVSTPNTPVTWTGPT